MARKVFIFVPAFGGTIRAETVKTLLSLNAALAQKGIQTAYSDFSFPDIAEARNIAVTIWHDTMPDWDHLLFIDSDMAFMPELVTDMLLFDEPLIGTLYRQRRPEIAWAGSGAGQITERRGDFMAVEGVGMGCTLIRREVIATMVEKMPELSDMRIDLHPAGPMLKSVGCNRMIRCFEKLDVPDRGIISEDLSFCIRWNRLGGKTWASIGHRISHVGPFDYQGRYLDVVEALAAQQIMPGLPQIAAPMTANATATLQSQPYYAPSEEPAPELEAAE